MMSSGQNRSSADSVGDRDCLLPSEEWKLPETKLRASRKTLGPHPWPWVLSTVILACSTLYLWFCSSQTSCHLGEQASAADIKTALATASRKQVTFTGQLEYDANGTLVTFHAPDEKVWIGDPSPQIDALWDSISKAEIIYLDGKDADEVRGRSVLWNGYWLSGLDVFHQLHCLNTVRKALYPEYYTPQASPRTEKLHTEHCLDYVRQALMCNADTTAVTHRWFPTAHKYGPNFATTHSCRSFDTLFQWSLERNSAAIKGRSGGETSNDPSLKISDEWIQEQMNSDGHHGHGH